MLCAVAVILVHAAPLRAETPLEAELARIVEDSALPGPAYALIEGGEITEIGAVGRVAPDPDAPPMTAATPMRAGSVSKTVTSLLAVALASDGVLSLDAEVATLLPDLALDDPWAEEATLCLVHLPEHTSGLPGSAYADYADAPPGLSPSAFAADLTPRPRWSPGRFYSYANANHALAAAVMEAATGEPFDAFVRERVLDSLGMQGATFLAADPRMEGLAPSFDASGRAEGFWEMAFRPSGALILTVEDLARLARLFATGEPEVVPPEALARMWDPRTSLAARDGYTCSYGLGLFGFLAADRVFWGHWGRVNGFQATFGAPPGEGRGFALLANGADRRAFGRTREILAARGLPAPEPPPPVATDLAPFEGWWRPFTDDMVQRVRISELLCLTRIRAGEHRLLADPALLPGEPRGLIPVSARSYRQESAPIAPHVFSEADRRLVLLGDGQTSYERVPAAQAWALLGGLGLAVATVVLSLLGGGWALVRAPRGRPPGAGWPAFALAGAALLAPMTLHLLWGMLAPLTVVAELGRPSLRATILLGLSVLWPSAALLGVWSLLHGWPRHASAGRALAVATAAGYALAAVRLARHDGLPLVTW